MTFDLPTIWNLSVAVLGGLAVGIERQWSGHAAGPNARFAGLRTFTLLGIVSGLSGWLWTSGLQGLAIVFLAGLSALVVMVYVAASKRDVDGTTEVGAFVVMAAGVLAGAGMRTVASAIIALTVLLLFEKRQLHRLVSKLDRVEMQAAARFAVMAAVILPILPPGPFGPLGGIKPRALWGLVLFFSGISFAGYIARRTIGRDRGYAIAGLLGGIVSSTGTTLTLARLSRSHQTIGRALAAGVMGANAMLFPRVLVATLVLAPALAREVWPALIVPFAIGVLLLLRGWRDTSGAATIKDEQNPLQFVAAVQMALIFQVVLFVMHAAKEYLGDRGILGSAAILGLADMDALTISLANQTTAGIDPTLAARALCIGLFANTCVKLTMAISIGRGAFRPLTAIGLSAMGVALAVAVFWRW